MSFIFVCALHRYQLIVVPLSGVGFSSIESEPDATLNYITGEQGYINEQGKRTFSFEHLYIQDLLHALSLHQVTTAFVPIYFGRYLETHL